MAGPDNDTPARARRSPLYSAVIGLAGLAVLLQGVWAGAFIRYGQRWSHTWIEVHNIGALVAIALALIATVIAIVQLRDRRAIVIGSIVFTVLLAAEDGLGAAIHGAPGITVVHIPLAMALMGLAVWLPLRAARG